VKRGARRVPGPAERMGLGKAADCRVRQPTAARTADAFAGPASTRTPHTDQPAPQAWHDARRPGRREKPPYRHPYDAERRPCPSKDTAQRSRQPRSARNGHANCEKTVASEGSRSSHADYTMSSGISFPQFWQSASGRHTNHTLLQQNCLRTPGQFGEDVAPLFRDFVSKIVPRV
jgi:hypothetical protein